MLTKRIKLFSAALLGLALMVFMPATASAHNSFITFSPTDAGYGTLTRFTITTTQQVDDSLQTVRVMLPQGLKNVSGVVNAGWVVTTTDEYVQWQGLLNKGQTVDLTFAATTPKTGDNISFKVFRTFLGGMTDDHTFTVELGKKTSNSKQNPLPIILGAVGIVLGATALVVAVRKNKPAIKQGK